MKYIGCVDIIELTKMRKRGLGLLERSFFDTSSSTRELNATVSARSFGCLVLRKIDTWSGKSLTSNPADLVQLLTQRVLPIDIEIVSHESSVAEQTESSSFLPAGENLVSIVPNLRVFDAFFVILPETLNTTSTFVLISHIIAESTLNTSRHIVPIAIPHGLKCKELRRIQCYDLW